MEMRIREYRGTHDNKICSSCLFIQNITKIDTKFAFFTILKSELSWISLHEDWFSYLPFFYILYINLPNLSYFFSFFVSFFLYFLCSLVCFILVFTSFRALFTLSLLLFLLSFIIHFLLFFLLSLFIFSLIFSLISTWLNCLFFLSSKLGLRMEYFFKNILSIFYFCIFT